MRPYIGITGFMSQYEVILARNAFLKERQNPDYLLMVGVLASLKTLYGHTNKRPNRYPILKDVRQIFIHDPGILNMLNLIHYNSKNTELLFTQLMAITESMGKQLFHGFQLNIAWPDELELLSYKSHYPDKKIVLQIGSGAFEEIENSPEKLVERLGLYAGLIDYILLDMSGGKGKPLNTEILKEYLRAIKVSFARMDIGLGVAEVLGRTQCIL